jgi:hypothetical protein
MNRKIVTAVTLLFLGLGLRADANLGETKEQSINHYGRILWTHNGYYGFNTRYFWISEWFNNSGYCEQIAYFKKNGDFKQSETSAFMRVNYPADALNQGWGEKEVTGGDGPGERNTRIWFTTDGVWRFESGAVKYANSKYFYASIMFGTVRAAAQTGGQTQDQNQNGDQGQEQPAKEDATILPL